MMVYNEIWIWNSMASRRRSASDIFEENGLYILKAALEQNSYKIKIIDWATKSGYRQITPIFLSAMNHLLFLLARRTKPFTSLNQFFSRFSSDLQQYLGEKQKQLLKQKLNRLALDVYKKRIGVVGIKTWYGEAFTMAKYFCDRVHHYSPETIVIAGGYHASLYEEDILRYSNIDLAIAGNGEEPLQQVMEFLNSEDMGKTAAKPLELLIQKTKLNPVPGLIYRDSGQVLMHTRKMDDINHQIVPRYKKQSGKIKVHILLESLGCPWNECSFCVHDKFSDGYHARKVDDIIREIKAIRDQGIGLFRFAGSDTPPFYGKTIANAILNENLTIRYTMGCRAVKNCDDESVFNETVDAFQTMILSGLRGIFIGGETANDLINDKIMNKGITSGDIEYTIKAVRLAEKMTNIRCTVSLALIFPVPVSGHLTQEMIKEDNLKFLEKVRPDAVMVSPPAPFKNTEWYNKSEYFGFDLAPDYIPKMMEYEYVLYKPLDLWPDIPFSLRGMHFKQMLGYAQALRTDIETKIGIPTDLSDEHFLMIRSSGKFSEHRIRKFKRKSQQNIITSNYYYINMLGKRISRYSRKLSKR